MRTVTIANPRTFAFAALGCLAGLSVVRAQESWGGSGSASSWQAGSAKAAAPVARSVASGAGSSWTAGQGSAPIRSQPGGVWNDSSTFPVAPHKPSAASSAAGANLLSRPIGSTRTGLSHAGAAPRKMQVSSLASASHSAGGPRVSGVTHGAIGSSSGVRNASQRRGGAGGRRRQSVSQSGGRATSLSSGPVSPLQSSSPLKSLTPALPAENLGSELPTPLGAMTH